MIQALYFIIGWGMWSFSHYVIHRWWHDDMTKGKETFYAQGERQHHHIYDHNETHLTHELDPSEEFINFPLKHIAPMLILPLPLAYWLGGGVNATFLGVAMYGSMFLDYFMHLSFHEHPDMKGVRGYLQRLHMVHHETHNRNFFFTSGFLWDFIFRTVTLPAKEEIK